MLAPAGVNQPPVLGAPEPVGLPGFSVPSSRLGSGAEEVAVGVVEEAELGGDGLAEVAGDGRVVEAAGGRLAGAGQVLEEAGGDALDGLGELLEPLLIDGAGKVAPAPDMVRAVAWRQRSGGRNPRKTSVGRTRRPIAIRGLRWGGTSVTWGRGSMRAWLLDPVRFR